MGTATVTQLVQGDKMPRDTTSDLSAAAEQSVRNISAYFKPEDALELLRMCIGGDNPFATIARQDPRAATSPAIRGLRHDCASINQNYPTHKAAIDSAMRALRAKTEISELVAGHSF